MAAAVAHHPHTMPELVFTATGEWVPCKYIEWRPDKASFLCKLCEKTADENHMSAEKHKSRFATYGLNFHPDAVTLLDGSHLQKNTDFVWPTKRSWGSVPIAGGLPPPPPPPPPPGLERGPGGRQEGPRAEAHVTEAEVAPEQQDVDRQMPDASSPEALKTELETVKTQLQAVKTALDAVKKALDELNVTVGLFRSSMDEMMQMVAAMVPRGNAARALHRSLSPATH